MRKEKFEKYNRKLSDFNRRQKEKEEKDLEDQNNEQSKKAKKEQKLNEAKKRREEKLAEDRKRYMDHIQNIDDKLRTRRDEEQKEKMNKYNKLFISTNNQRIKHMRDENVKEI